MNDALIVYLIFNLFLFIMAGYIFMKTTPDLMKKREYTIFKVFVVAFCVYVVFNSIWTMQEYTVIKMPDILFRIICFMSFASVLFNCLCFYKFTMIHYGYNDTPKPLYEFFGVLPFLITIVLLIISFWNNMIFSTSVNVTIVRGPLYMILALSSFIYFGIIMVCSFVEMFRKKSPQARKDCLTLLLLVIFLVAWVVFDDYLQGLTIIPIAIFGVLFVLFTTFQQSSINTDALTQMNNRRKAIEYLTNQFENVSVVNPLYLYLIDINLFKDINDKYGHQEGDSALIILAESIKEVVGEELGFAARYGGDEFIIVVKPREGVYYEDDIIKKIDNICKGKCMLQHKPYEISITYGCMRCTDSSLSVESYFKEVDDLLYKNKRKQR